MTKPLCRSKTIFKLLVGQSLTIPADVLHYQDEYLFMRGKVLNKDKNRKDCMVVRVDRIQANRFYFEVCDIVRWLDDPEVLREVPAEYHHLLGTDVATIIAEKQHEYVGNVRNPDYKTTSSGGSEPESRDGDTKNESGSATSESGKEALLDHVTASRAGGSQLISGALARGMQYIMQSPKSHVISSLMESREPVGKHATRSHLPHSLLPRASNATLISTWHGSITTKPSSARKRSADVSPVKQPTQKAARLAERVLSYGNSLAGSHGSSSFYMAVTKLQQAVQEAASQDPDGATIAAISTPTPGVAAPRVLPTPPPTAAPSRVPNTAVPASSDMSSDATQKMSQCDDEEDDVTWPGLTAWFGGNWGLQQDTWGHGAGVLGGAGEVGPPS